MRKTAEKLAEASAGWDAMATSLPQRLAGTGARAFSPRFHDAVVAVNQVVASGCDFGQQAGTRLVSSPMASSFRSASP